MPGEQRVTDAQITELRKAATCVYIAVEEAVAADMSRIFSAAAQTIHDLDTAHRATEAKLREALAEVEKVTRAYDHAVSKWQETAKTLAEVSADFRLARTMQEETRVKWLDEAQRATTAESALAATKAKMEAAKLAISKVIICCSGHECERKEKGWEADRDDACRWHDVYAALTKETTDAK